MRSWANSSYFDCGAYRANDALEEVDMEQNVVYLGCDLLIICSFDYLGVVKRCWIDLAGCCA